MGVEYQTGGRRGPDQPDDEVIVSIKILGIFSVWMYNILNRRNEWVFH